MNLMHVMLSKIDIKEIKYMKEKQALSIFCSKKKKANLGMKIHKQGHKRVVNNCVFLYLGLVKMYLAKMVEL